MKIGIFGDSYAEKCAPSDAWWQRLKFDHGNDVTSYGEAGSSIAFSMNLLEKFHDQFDFNIWCLTTPGRISIPLGHDNFFHSTNHLDTSGNAISTTKKDRAVLIDVSRNYLKYIFDWNYENLVGKLLVEHYLKNIPNLMIIPCFPPPLNTEYNLYKICETEIQSVFPNKQVHVHEIYQEYYDKRSCHLTTTNNKILSDIIAQNLSPGILKVQCSDFCFDNIEINSVLGKKL
jgi:hypothetical protein